MTAIRKIFIALLVALIATSCQTEEEKKSGGGGPTNNEVADKPLTDPVEGWINGQEWKFVSGRAFLRKYNHQEFLIVDLWNFKSSDPCTETKVSRLRVRVRTIPEIARWTLSPFKNVPFVRFIDADNTIFLEGNIVADTGYLQTLKIGNEVHGQLAGRYSSTRLPKTEVIGSFLVPLCDQNFL